MTTNVAMNMTTNVSMYMTTNVGINMTANVLQYDSGGAARGRGLENRMEGPGSKAQDPDPM